MRVLNLIQKITESHYVVIGLAFFVGLIYPAKILWAVVPAGGTSDGVFDHELFRQFDYAA